jgi:hypothetical protein
MSAVFLFQLGEDYLTLFFSREWTPPNSPQRARTAAQQNEQDQRVLDSPVRHRTLHHVRMLRMAQPPPPPPLLPPAPVYNHLPAHLAQQLAALPPLLQRGRGRGRGHGRAPPVPVPANVNDPFAAPLPVAPHHYNHLPAHLAQQLAALPPLGRGNGIAPPPVPFPNAAVQYPALPPLPPPPVVCIQFHNIYINLLIMALTLATCCSFGFCFGYP